MENNIVNKLRMINGINLKQKEIYNKSERLKTFIITMINDSYSVYLARKCITEISGLEKTYLDPVIVPATTPRSIKEDIKKLNKLNNSEGIPWNWPIKEDQNGYCLKTGLYKEIYDAKNQLYVMATTISHIRMWQMCIDLNQPIMVLEHDACIVKDFNFEDIDKDKTWGVLGLNSPFYAIARANTFRNRIANKGPGIHDLPSLNEMCDLPYPQKLAGNSAYVIRPWAAKQLLEKVQEVGYWPNDSFLCKQLFPWIKVVYPFYTHVRSEAKSTIMNVKYTVEDRFDVK